MDKSKTMSMMNASLDSNLGLSLNSNSDVSYHNGISNGSLNCWGYWQDYYYPTVIRESYPVYIQERAKDKAKHAYEIVKILKDKKLAKLEKVSDFIDLMDELIKIL